MLFDRHFFSDHSLASAITCCAALTLTAGLAIAGPDDGATPTKITNLDGANDGGEDGTAGKKDFTRLLLPSRGKTMRVDVYGMEKQEAVAVPTWARAMNKRNEKQGIAPFQYTIDSTMIVEVEQEIDLHNCLADLGISKGPAWITANVTALDSDNTVFAVDFVSVMQTIKATEKLLGDARIREAEVSVNVINQVRSIPTDPLVPLQYHLANPIPDYILGGRKQDHGLSTVYDMGYTGQGVQVGVMEVGSYSYQATHEDLERNHSTELSQSETPFLYPSFFVHSNAVAGLIAAEADNGLGGAGVAYNAELAILLNGSDVERIKGFMWKNDIIDIKNNSWGPVGFSGSLTNGGQFATAFNDVADYADSASGRALRGTADSDGVIYVNAAGNDGIWAENISSMFTNATTIDPDGNLIAIASLGSFQKPSENTPRDYAFSGTWTGIGLRTEYDSMSKWREILAIAATGEDNQIAGYSTTGTNIVAAAYSQGFNNVKQFTDGTGSMDDIDRLPHNGIVSASASDGFDMLPWGPNPLDPAADPSDDNLLDNYLDGFNGTSAAAPITTGIIALMLEANPDLTVRDIKTIFQETCDWTRIPEAFNDLVLKPYISPGVVFGWAFGQGFNSTMWQVNGGYQVHSDEYGFGIIDADAAVNAASLYTGAPELFTLDTGLITSGLAIPGVGYIESGELQMTVDVANLQIVSPPIVCIRANYRIEEVELTVNILGGGSGDLLIGLQTGGGSSSTFALPRYDPTTWIVNGVNYAYSNYKFNSLKHWGELSGGEWTLILSDMAPDTRIPIQGEEDDNGEPVNAAVFYPPGTSIGEDGVYEPKVLESYRLRIFATKTSEDPYPLCPLGSLNCPGDWDGDGWVTPADLMAFLEAYLAGSFLADFDNDGDVDYDDLLLFYLQWSPGPCNGPDNPGRKQPSEEPTIIGVG